MRFTFLKALSVPCGHRLTQRKDDVSRLTIDIGTRGNSDV